MTKQESTMLKGVAILFMIFGHLFLHPELANEMYIPLFCLNGLSIENIMTRATGPVGFYLLLGGYGMYYIYKNRGVKNQLPRIRNLYINFWIVLLLFVLIGYFIHPNAYPGSFGLFINNATGFNTTYNGEWWFLLPYSLLVLSSYWVFQFVDKYNPLLVVLCCLLGLFATSFVISRFGADYLYSHKLRYNLFLYFHLLWEFVIGAMLLKMDFFGKSKTKIQKYLTKDIYILIALILLIAVRCIFDTSAVHIFYVVTFIALFLSISRWSFIDKSLSFFGTYSMNMWFIHTCICYYLFKDFIYGFKYPIIIYTVVVVLSLIFAIFVTKIANIVIPKARK